MTTLQARQTIAPAPVAVALHRLYLVRAGFAIVWALLLGLLAPTLGPLSIALLLLYPLVDLGAAVVDHHASSATRPTPALFVNMALSLLAAVGLLLAVRSGASPSLFVWGVWAVTAGAVQLAVGLRRRALGGQGAMIASGSISILAGAGFIAQSAGAGSVAGVAGYAVLGGIFFLVSALRLPQTASRVT
jgi:uncharacterized membrane protein HdeD (DUF308 family)